MKHVKTLLESTLRVGIIFVLVWIIIYPGDADKIQSRYTSDQIISSIVLIMFLDFVYAIISSRKVRKRKRK